MISNQILFAYTEKQVDWIGKLITNINELNTFLEGPVLKRLTDEDLVASFEEDMSELLTTDMAKETLQKYLSLIPEIQPWQIGEAFAECILQEEHGVKWPWNMERDKRTPKASLAGADLIGLIEISGKVYLLLGEVKTSEDPNSPPQVMYGRGGMIHQLDNLAENLRIHRSIIIWLYSRCKGTDFMPLYEEAMKLYFNSRGHAVVLVGILLRSTTPNELDLRSRAKALSEKISSPTKVELVAWYAPDHPISRWSCSNLGHDT